MLKYFFKNYEGKKKQTAVCDIINLWGTNTTNAVIPFISEGM